MIKLSDKKFKGVWTRPYSWGRNYFRLARDPDTLCGNNVYTGSLKFLVCQSPPLHSPHPWHSPSRSSTCTGPPHRRSHSASTNFPLEHSWLRTADPRQLCSVWPNPKSSPAKTRRKHSGKTQGQNFLENKYQYSWSSISKNSTPMAIRPPRGTTIYRYLLCS